MTYDFNPGDFNVAPTDFHEIDEKEFVTSEFFGYLTTACLTHGEKDEKERRAGYEYRQLYRSSSGEQIKSMAVFLFWFGECWGYGLASDYWKGKVKYYRFGCDHQGTEAVTIGNCLHRYTCPKCGRTQVIDSSG